jgi:hypothetical protein
MHWTWRRSTLLCINPYISLHFLSFCQLSDDMDFAVEDPEDSTVKDSVATFPP